MSKSLVTNARPKEMPKLVVDVTLGLSQSILYIKATVVSVCVGSAWKILPVTARSLWSCIY